MQKYDIALLQKALRHHDKQFIFWATYQLISQYPEQSELYIVDLLKNKNVAIQEMVLDFLVKQEIIPNNLLPYILYIFDSSIEKVKAQAAQILAVFKENELISQKLRNWANFVLNFETLDISMLSSMTKTLLSYNSQFYFPYLLDLIHKDSQNVIHKSILYEHLFYAVSDKIDRFASLLQSYCLVMKQDRSRFLIDAQIHYWRLGQLCDWIEDSCLTALSLNQVILDIFQSMQFLPSAELAEKLQLLSDEFSLDKYRKGYKSITPKFMSFLGECWQIATKNRQYHHMPYFNIIFSTLTAPEYLERQLPTKVRTEEVIFLLAILLHVIIEVRLLVFFNEPTEYASAISMTFYSSFISVEQQDKILNKFFPDKFSLTEQDVLIQEDQVFLNDIEHLSEIQVLWKLYSREWLGRDIDWAQILPYPSDKRLFSILFLYFKANFKYYIRKGNNKAINYALSIFIDYNSREIIPLIFDNFDYLVRFHFNTLCNVIQWLPDPCYVVKLSRLYQASFIEIKFLIQFLAYLYDLPLDIGLEEETQEISNNKRLEYQSSSIKYNYNIKLYCDACCLFSLLTMDLIYVNEKAMLQSETLTKADVWTDKEFSCLYCGRELELNLDYEGMKELEIIARNELFLSLSTSTKTLYNYTIVLLPFPYFQGKTYNPKEFMEFAARANEDSLLTAQEKEEITSISLQLYKKLKQWDQVLLLLDKIKKDTWEWRLEKAMAEFYSEHQVKARQYFISIKDEIDALSTVTVEQERLRTRVTFFLQLIDSYHAQRKYLKIIK